MEKNQERWAFAKPESVLLAAERDIVLISEIEGYLSEIFAGSVLGSKSLRCMSHLLYRLFSLWQTIGQESQQIRLVEDSRGRFPSLIRMMILNFGLTLLDPQLMKIDGLIGQVWKLVWSLQKSILLWGNCAAYETPIHRILSLRPIHYPQMCLQKMSATSKVLLKAASVMILIKSVHDFCASIRSCNNFKDIKLLKPGKTDKTLAERDVEKKSFFECPMCMDNAVDPTVTSCGHVFCWECICSWLMRRQKDSCPVCRKHCLMTMLYTINK